MALRMILTEGEPALRKSCREVVQVDDRIRQILDDMAETMYANQGGGLAANQVGILRRLITVDMGSGLYRLVNPVIVQQEGEQEVIEGCLSIPGRSGKLLRPQKVTVQALDEQGVPVTIEAEDDLAKCFCHEIDHLNGILYSDHVIKWL